MENTWIGKPTITDSFEPLPSESFAALTTSLQLSEPHGLQGLLKSAQAIVIAWYCIVLTPALVDRR